MRKIRVYDDSLSVEVMQYLAASGAVPRKNLYTPFVGYAYRYYARVIKRLLDEGYLELFRQGRLNHVKITPKGEGVLKDKLEDDVQFLPKNKTGTAKRKRRQSLVADVIGLCEANGMVISAAAKPNLAQLYGSAPEEKKKDFVAQLEKGIFYSSGEIRQAYMQVMGNNEIANWSRLVGIVLLKDNLTFIYSVNQSLIKWMAGSEDRTVRFIIQFLRKSELLQSQIRFFEHPSCIVCGRGMSMIPKIVTGRKWGRVSEDDGSERYKAKIARDHINSHNLAKVFSAAYFVTADRNGVENFRFAALLNEDVKERLCDQWFSSVATATRVKAFDYHQGLTAKRERVVYMPYMDLIELEFYKRQGEPCHFVIPAKTQDAVARVMGPLLLSAQSLKGVKLKYNQYDALGALIKPGTAQTAQKG